MKTLIGIVPLILIGGCSTVTNTTRNISSSCESLAGQVVAPADIGLPSGAAKITSALLKEPTPLKIAERGPVPAGLINPANPKYCEVQGAIAPLDPNAPNIEFQVNLPVNWNGRSVQYGGGGFNGVLITGLALPPAAPFDAPAPLARGFVTVGTDSGHQNKPGVPPQAFALNDEALVNFSHAAYKKVKDVSVAIMKLAYGKGPQQTYFVGSSEGGREGLTMAQRYPADFNGIFSRVPVIHWTGLQHTGLRDGLATVGDGWIRPAQTKLVHDAVLAACDSADGLADGLISDPVGCKARFDVQSLLCKPGAAPDSCLSEAQVRAVKTLHAPHDVGVDLANGLRSYPGRGPSGENLPSMGPTGGWNAWWLGQVPPNFPATPNNSIAWFYGAGAIQYFYARDPKADLKTYSAQQHAARVKEVSALMDSTNPDLSAFHAKGGKLIMLENMADYAQSPYAGIAYAESVKDRMGAHKTAEFFRLYTAPNVDHVGTGGPANVDMLSALQAWVEQGRAPTGLQLVEQTAQLPLTIKRSRPLCEWPTWPKYIGGDANLASSFQCVK